MSTISLISLSTPTCPCVLELDFCSHLVLPYPKEHVLRWKNIYLGIHCILLSVQLQTSSCSWFSPWIYDTSIFMYIKELSRLVHGHLLIVFSSMVYLTRLYWDTCLLCSAVYLPYCSELLKDTPLAWFILVFSALGALQGTY